MSKPQKILCIFFIFILFLCSPAIFAERISEEDAYSVASMHLRVQQGIWQDQLDRSKIYLTQGYHDISGIRPLFDENLDILAYVADLDPAGFIVVSPDTDIAPIIAYSYRGFFNVEEDEENIFYHMLKLDMQLRLQAIPFLDAELKTRNRALWKNYLDGGVLLQQKFQTASQWPPGDDDGWLSTCWDQDSPYNDVCPIDPITGIRCVAGCTATAIAQIIHYWKHPASASFSDADNYVSLEDPGDGNGIRTIYIDVEADGHLIQDEYEYDLKNSMARISYYPLTNLFKAELSFACGVTALMGYSSAASGAPLSTASDAMKNKWSYASSNWRNVSAYPSFYSRLTHNMKAGWPAALGIAKKTSGGQLYDFHAIVADGYRSTGEYHLNFGWGCNSPNSITQSWYFLPQGMPVGYSVITDAVLDICLTTDPYEPNDSRSEAFPITLSGTPPVWNSSPGTEIKPMLSLTDDDWFQFAASAGDQLIITCDVTSSLWARVVLYHENNHLKTVDALASGDDIKFYHTCPSSGNYFVGVGFWGHLSAADLRVQSDSQGTYSLRVEKGLDPYEPNDTRASAYQISLSGIPPTWQSAAGTIILPSTDQDWFAVTASSGDVLTISCDVTSDLDAEIVLYYGNSFRASRDDFASGGDEFLAFQCMDSGTYYVGIGYYSNIAMKAIKQFADVGSYTLKVMKGGDPYEPNNTRGAAFPITFSGWDNSWTSGAGPEINPSSDLDWFKFSASAGDYLTITCDVTSLLDAEIVLYRDNTKVAGKDEGFSGDDEILTHTCSTDGTYYVGIGYYASISSGVSVQANSGSYELTVKKTGDPYEPNDTRSQAYTIKFDENGIWQSATAEIRPTTDQDWFKFRAVAGDWLIIKCAPSSSVDPKIVLYYGDYLVASVDDGYSGVDEELVYYCEKEGVYYVGIGDGSEINVKQVSAQLSIGPYTLNIKKCRDPYEPNNTRSEAYLILTGSPTWQTGFIEINPVADQDWFKFVGLEGVTYKITCNVTSSLDAKIVLYLYDTLVATQNVSGSGGDETLIHTCSPGAPAGVYFIGIGAAGLISTREMKVQEASRSYELKLENMTGVQQTLTISTGTGGTTDPAPGFYTYAFGTNVSIQAKSNAGYKFSNWTGDFPSGHGTDNPIVIVMDGNKSITAHFIPINDMDDIFGTWSTGVWYRNSDTGSWVKMATPAQMVVAGDIDGDSTDDLIGMWSSGLWVKYSSSGSWAKLSTTLPTNIASGDMSGDGRDDILGSWPSGVWYRNSVTGSWMKMTTPADLVATGDLDDDGIDDLIGVWSSGLWVKYSSRNSWLLITPILPTSIASGDMNGDGRDDILGTWPSGVWYKNSIGGSWVKMSTPANLVAAGDADGDGTDDLIGTWSSGLWVKNSSTTSWQFICTSLPSDIDAGLFRTGWGAGAMSYDAPVAGVYAEGPGDTGNYEDITSEAPKGWNFVYEEEENLKPHEIEVQRMIRTPGPGEPGFKGIEQKNLVPMEMIKSNEKRIKLTSTGN